MGNNLRFIHAADIHLGSFLHLSNRPQEQIKCIIDNAVFTAFEEIVKAAVQNAVDFLIISGDIFESHSRSIRADNFFCEMMKKLNGIEVYIICGNHDPYRDWKEIFKLPDNVHLFGCNQVEEFNFIKNQATEARLLGISYRTKKEGRNVLSDFNRSNDGIPGIGLFHSQLEVSSDSYMPAAVSDMLSTEGISYWALGHIHKPRIINENKPCAVYPGIPQGRDFGEEGAGGCLLVEMDNKYNTSLKYIPTSPVVFEKIEIDMDEAEMEELQDITDIEDMIAEKARLLVSKNLNTPENISCADNVESVVKGFVVQWIIKGRGNVHSLISGKEEEIGEMIASDLNEQLSNSSEKYFIHTDSVVFRTSPRLPGIDELALESPIYKVLINAAAQYSENSILKKELIGALGDIWDKKSDMEEEEPLKFYMEDETLQAIIKQAQQLILEKLYTRSENFES